MNMRNSELFNADATQYCPNVSDIMFENPILLQCRLRIPAFACARSRHATALRADGRLQRHHRAIEGLHFSQETGGDAGDHGAGGNVIEHHGAGADNGLLADADLLAHNRPGAHVRGHAHFHPAA